MPQTNHRQLPISNGRLRDAADCNSTGDRKMWRVATTLLLACLLAGCANDPAARMLSTGWQQLNAGQTEQALATSQNILTEMPSTPRAAEVHYLKGRAYEAKVASSPGEQRQNLALAMGAYDEALKHSPDNRLSGRIYSGVANVCYWQDDYSNAWRNWVKAFDLTDEPETKSYILYRIGLSQQRLGRFDEADKTYAAVIQEYPQSDAARRAAQKRGARGFGVQVATFASPQTADNAMNTLRREGFVPSKSATTSGNTVVTVTPFGSYQQAQAAKMRLAGLFPDAVVVP